MDRLSVAVLGVLDKEDHEERNDCRGGVDDQLPGVREMKRRPGNDPDQDNQERARESPRAAEYPRRSPGEDTKSI